MMEEKCQVHPELMTNIDEKLYNFSQKAVDEYRNKRPWNQE